MFLVYILVCLIEMVVLMFCGFILFGPLGIPITLGAIVLLIYSLLKYFYKKDNKK